MVENPSALKTERAPPSETSVGLYHSIRHQTPEDWIILVSYSIVLLQLGLGYRLSVSIAIRNVKTCSVTVSIFPRINLLTPNVNYSGRTAPLTSKVAFYIFIQQI